MHLSFDAIERGFRELPPPPCDRGRIALVVARPDVGARELVTRRRLTTEGGLEGDRWVLRDPPNPETQVTLIRADVARLLANGQPVELCGDNLHVELDLSAANLPAGSRIRVGTAICEVTPKPHTGCGKFSSRFGPEALEFTGAPAYKGLRLRGIHARVVEVGVVSPGDAIEVILRG